MRRNSARCRFLLPCGISFGFRDCFGTSTPFVARRHFRLSLFEGRRLFGARYRRGLPYKDFPRRAGAEKRFRQKLCRASVSSVFASFARRTRIQPYKDNKCYTVKRYRQQAYIMVREQCPLFSFLRMEICEELKTRAPQEKHLRINAYEKKVCREKYAQAFLYVRKHNQKNSEMSVKAKTLQETDVCHRASK